MLCVLVAQLCPAPHATPWTPLSMRFCRQGYGSGLQFPSPGDLPDPGIEPGSPALQADSLPTELQGLSCLKIFLINENGHEMERRKCQVSFLLESSVLLFGRE